MKKTTNLLALIFAIVFAFGLTSNAISQQYSGDLGPGDNKLGEGEFYDTYYENFTAGQRVTITMRSGTFDAYVMLTDPDDYTLENNDFAEGSNDAQLVVVIEKSGEYKIKATTYEGGITGNYTVTISSERTNFSSSERQIHNGQLALGDSKLADGEYSDVYYITVRTGQVLEVDVKSDELDTYLILFPPTADQVDNDDYYTKTNRSHITYRAMESGQYKIMVTTYEADETGPYSLEVNFDNGASSGGSGIRKN